MIDKTEEELVTKVRVLEEVIKVLAHELYGSDSLNEQTIEETAYIM
jgi:hypothetical protein